MGFVSRSLFAALIFVAGCGRDSPCRDCLYDLTGARDLAESLGDFGGSADLMTPDPADLSQPPDFTGFTFCANTQVAGTCAQTFFSSVAMCFSSAGMCTAMRGMTASNFCWQNGSKLLATLNGMTAHGTWLNNGTPCMDGDAVPSGMSVNLTLHVGNQTLVYNAGTGDVTCPDGTKTNIGPNEGGCAALTAILNPPVGGCVAGACM